MAHKEENRKLILMQEIYETIKSLSQKLDKEDDKYFKSLTTRQYMVIQSILHSPNGETTMIELAKKLDTTKQNINKLIPILEKKGYAKRSACENNKRAVNIKVTDSGVLAMKEHAIINASFLADIFNGLSEDEMESLLRLLKKLHGKNKIT